MFGPEYDVPPFCLICYDASFEASVVNLHERVLKFLLQFHIGKVFVNEEFITLSSNSWVKSLVPIFIVLSLFSNCCDVSGRWSSPFLPSLRG